MGIPVRVRHCDAGTPQGTDPTVAAPRLTCVVDVRHHGGMTDARFVVVGRELETFVSTWFEDLRSGGGEMRGLLDDGPDMAASFLMGNIAPRASKPDASDEELLLFATLAVAQEYFRDKRQEPVLDGWDAMWEYVCAAFDHLHDVGNEDAADVLVKSVLRGMQTPSEEVRQWLTVVWSKKTPAERAAHERHMAQIKQRELRAARLLHPDIDVDMVMLSMPLNAEE